jgi:DNA-binding response OmpR family regulator
VLLVDDEEIVRRVVRVVLEGEGHMVLDAAGSADCLRALSTSGADVVVLDLMLAGESGEDLCVRIRELAPEARVIVLTSVPLAEAPDLGADDYIEKPFSAIDLLNRVSALTAGP